MNGLNGWPGLLLGVPWIVTGKPERSAPVVTLIACRYQCGWLWSGPSSTFAVKYAVLLDGSYTGVEVMPMFGTRSPQPIAPAGHAGPTSRVQRIVPDTGSSPYTLSFSVATSNVAFTTIGCAYTWPSSCVANSCP